METKGMEATAKKYRMARATLWKHKKECMPAEMAQTVVISDIPKANSLFDEFLSLKTKTEEIMNNPEEPTMVRLMAIREVRGILNDMAKLSLWAHKVENDDKKTEASIEIQNLIKDIVQDGLQRNQNSV